MNEMLSRFVNEALSCLIIVPTTVLCLLPMKDKMKYSIKNVLPLFFRRACYGDGDSFGCNGIAPCRSEGSLLYSAGAFVPCVQVSRDADIVKCFATFLLSFAIMSFCKNYAIMMECSYTS